MATAQGAAVKKSKIVYQALLPRQLVGTNCLLIYDSVLEKKHGAWIRRFPHRHKVKSGEKLKDLRALPRDFETILKKVESISREDLQIVAFGGGSVGDYAGFVASLLRRGVGLVQVPSTWLAAMDSAHGGKTALNVGAFKNQIGTFYPAQVVYLVREVLLAQPPERVREVAGEYYKTQLLMKAQAQRKVPSQDQLTPQRLWADLPSLVQTKWKIVAMDPYETKGPRAWLNLGHSVGHVLEAALGLPHGVAVHLGLAFALRWSKQIGLWKGPLPENWLPSAAEVSRQLMRVKEPLRFVRRDKKMASANKIRFVFLKKQGYPLRKTMTLQDLLREWERQRQ